MSEPWKNLVEIEWNIHDRSTDALQLAFLIGIHRELRTLNRLLNCPNFVSMPSTLRTISRKLSKPKKARRAAPKKTHA